MFEWDVNDELFRQSTPEVAAPEPAAVKSKQAAKAGVTPDKAPAAAASKAAKAVPTDRISPQAATIELSGIDTAAHDAAVKAYVLACEHLHGQINQAACGLRDMMRGLAQEEAANQTQVTQLLLGFKASLTDSQNLLWSWGNPSLPNPCTWHGIA